MSKGEAQVNVTVPEAMKELAKEKLEHGGLSRLVREQLREVAYGEELSRRARLEERLERHQDRRSELKREKEEIVAEIDELEEKMERDRSRLSDLQSKEDEYQGALEMLEDQLVEGTHIFPEHGQVKKAAHLGEKDPDSVIDDLRERNPSVPEYAFVELLEARSKYGEEWNGVVGEPADS